MTVTIFFEGGGDKEATQSKCREGLSKYCARLKQPRSRVRIVAGGGREQTFDKFRRAVQGGRNGELSVLLVDSENPVTADTPAEHLHSHDGWDFTVLVNYKVFLMVQTMESWFLADRDALARFYDGGFLLNALPGSVTNVEIVRKEDVESSLKKATARTKTKGEYRKIEHGAALLALIDPLKVEAGSPHAASFHEFLREL